jgi:hypothetical protein
LHGDPLQLAVLVAGVGLVLVGLLLGLAVVFEVADGPVWDELGLALVPVGVWVAGGSETVAALSGTFSPTLAPVEEMTPQVRVDAPATVASQISAMARGWRRFTHQS